MKYEKFNGGYYKPVPTEVISKEYEELKQQLKSVEEEKANWISMYEGALEGFEEKINALNLKIQDFETEVPEVKDVKLLEVNAEEILP